MCVVEGLYFLSFAMNPVAPDGAPPLADQGLYVYLQTPISPAVPRRGPEAGDPPEIAGFNDFHGSGANARSCSFLQSSKRYRPVRFLYSIPTNNSLALVWIFWNFQRMCPLKHPGNTSYQELMGGIEHYVRRYY
jgi:hypothetical protein